MLFNLLYLDNALLDNLCGRSSFVAVITVIKIDAI